MCTGRDLVRPGWTSVLNGSALFMQGFTIRANVEEGMKIKVKENRMKKVIMKQKEDEVERNI